MWMIPAWILVPQSTLSTGIAFGEPIPIQVLTLLNSCSTSFNIQSGGYSNSVYICLLILCSLAGFVGHARLALECHINLQWSSNNSTSHILKRSLIIKRGVNNRAWHKLLHLDLCMRMDIFERPCVRPKRDLRKLQLLSLQPRVWNFSLKCSILLIPPTDSKIQIAGQILGIPTRLKLPWNGIAQRPRRRTGRASIRVELGEHEAAWASSAIPETSLLCGFPMFPVSSTRQWAFSF